MVVGGGLEVSGSRNESWLVRRLRTWVRREAREEIQSELRKTRVWADDPLADLRANAAHVEAQLQEAANRVGREVLVGHGVVLWGGRFPGGLGLELHDHV